MLYNFLWQFYFEINVESFSPWTNRVNTEAISALWQQMCLTKDRAIEYLRSKVHNTAARRQLISCGTYVFRVLNQTRDEIENSNIARVMKGNT
jgi:hypothetical protein